MVHLNLLLAGLPRLDFSALRASSLGRQGAPLPPCSLFSNQTRNRKVQDEGQVDAGKARDRGHGEAMK